MEERRQAHSRLFEWFGITVSANRLFAYEACAVARLRARDLASIETAQSIRLPWCAEPYSPQ